MGAEIVNLRRARKAKARVEKEQDAEANRRKFGRPRREREQTEAETELAVRRLDQHRLATPKPGAPDKPDRGR